MYARTLLATLGLAAGLIGSTAATPAQALDGACRNQPGDVSVLDLVGVDQYDPPPGGNGLIAVCVGNAPYSGVQVAQGPNGTCVAVIIFGQKTGCQDAILIP